MWSQLLGVQTTGEKVAGHICLNRGECVNLRELRGRSLSRVVERTKVGSQSIVFKPGQVAETKDAINKQAGDGENKRRREETGNTPEKEEQALKTPKTVANKSVAIKSKLVKPGQIGCEARGGKTPASSL